VFRRQLFKKRFQATASISLNRLITISDTAEASAENAFVESALQAAVATPGQSRRDILTDVAELLSCSPEALGFLFNAPVMPANDRDPVEMPDYRASLDAGCHAFAH
jgi:hypothetical protein